MFGSLSWSCWVMGPWVLETWRLGLECGGSTWSYEGSLEAWKFNFKPICGSSWWCLWWSSWSIKGSPSNRSSPWSLIGTSWSCKGSSWNHKCSSLSYFNGAKRSPWIRESSPWSLESQVELSRGSPWSHGSTSISLASHPGGILEHWKVIMEHRKACLKLRRPSLELWRLTLELPRLPLEQKEQIFKPLCFILEPYRGSSWCIVRSSWSR